MHARLGIARSGKLERSLGWTREGMYGKKPRSTFQQ